MNTNPPQDQPPVNVPRPRFSWWSANWSHIAPWAAVVVSLAVGAGTIFFATTNLLRETHENYRRALVSWEAGLREDVRALRSETQTQFAELRIRIESHEDSEDHNSFRRPPHQGE